MNRRKRMMENLDQDIRDYIERETQDNIERGMPPEEARYAALRKFGNVARVKEDTWEVWSFGWVEQLWQDVRYGLRMLGKNPAFTAIAVLTMALGIGANSAIFSVINAVLLRPLPYRNPGQLLAIYEMPNVRNKSSQMPVAYPDFLDWRAQSRTLEGISAYKWNPFTLTGTSEPVHVEGYIVSANLFSALGVNPALGRTFLAEEDQIGHHTAILSHRLWRECFDSDPKVVGQSVRLDTTTFTVVGVMPAGFQFPIQAKPVDIWVAQGANTEVPGRGSHYLQVIARSRPDVTFDQARAEMAAIADGLARQFPDSNRDEGVKIVSEHEALVGQVRSAMLVLFGVVVLVLLIALPMSPTCFWRERRIEQGRSRFEPHWEEPTAGLPASSLQRAS